MRLTTWLIFGALAGLGGGLLLDSVLHLPTMYMRLVQLSLIVFGAVVAAFVYEGARAVTGGREPKHFTDRPRRPWLRARAGRATRGHSGPAI